MTKPIPLADDLEKTATAGDAVGSLFHDYEPSGHGELDKAIEDLYTSLKHVSREAGEAADLIRQLTEALEPFHKLAEACEPHSPNDGYLLFGVGGCDGARLTMGDVRTAAAALKAARQTGRNGHERS